MELTATEGGTPAAGSVVAYQAGIHRGTRDDLGDVAFDLGPVSSDALGATPQVDVDDPGHGNVIARGQATVDASLDELRADEHAIGLQQPNEDADRSVACGMIEIELLEADDSGVTGQAILGDNVDGTTEVTITLLDAEGWEEATPRSSGGDGPPRRRPDADRFGRRCSRSSARSWRVMP